MNRRAPGCDRAATVVALVLGLGFGVPCAVGLVHLARTGEVWQFLGLPTYGDGPFERFGITTTVPLMATFLLVCLAETMLAGLLWTGQPVARRMSHALLPVELVFWIGFALPVGPPLGLARSGLVFLPPPGRPHVDRAPPRGRRRPPLTRSPFKRTTS